MKQEIPFALGPHALPEALRSIVASFVDGGDRSLEARADLVIALSRASCEGGGGPFGAAVFDTDGSLVSVGINRVIPWDSYEFHAEGVALAMAKLRAPDGYMLPERWTLVTSSAPCCMCFGRIYWCGLRGLVVCARREDVESITGFDEGPIPEEWQRALESAGFSVHEDVRRAQAREVLVDYRGPLYQRASR